MSVKLFNHNYETYAKMSEMFEAENRVAVVQPTGTGKSYLMLKWIEDHPDDNIIVLSPSNEIFEQINDIAKENNVPMDNVEEYTYQKLNRCTEEDINKLHPDKIVMDEFHRAGAEQWGTSIEYLLECNKESKVLGVSATPVRYLDGSRNMADELFDNNIANYMSLGEAVERGILPVPTYIPVWYDIDNKLSKYQNEINEFDSEEERAEAEELLKSLKKHLENSYGAEDIFEKYMSSDHGKYIVFCKDREHLYLMEKQMKLWLRGVNEKINSYITLCDMTKKECGIEAFKNDKDDTAIRLLFAVERLNEGVHVKDIDGVIMLRPTISPTIYLQQIGRSLSVGSGKTPIIFDMVNNYQNVKTTDQETGERKNVFEEEILESSRIRKRGESDTEEFIFGIFEKMIEFNKVFEELDKLLPLDNYSRWMKKFNILSEFKTKYNRFPTNRETFKGENIGVWLGNQRCNYIIGKLSKERQELLESIGVIFSSILDVKWTRKLELLKEFKTIYNRFPSFNDTFKGENIGVWLSVQRKYYKEGKLSKERQELLESVGVIFVSILDVKWKKNLELLKEFKSIYNRFPNNKETFKGENIGVWLSVQRKYYKEGKLSKERQELLESVGVCIIGKFTIIWRKKLELLKEFKTIYNRLPSYDCVFKGEHIGRWLCIQRKCYRSGKLSKERKELLESVGVVFD